LDSSSSSALRSLLLAFDSAAPSDHDRGLLVDRWLDVLDREGGYFIAMLRLAAETRRAAWDKKMADADNADAEGSAR